MEINWTEIEGYNENMSAEEKLVLLANHTPKEPSPAPDPEPSPEPAPAPEPAPEVKPKPDPKPEGKTVPKAMLDKALSEVASMKKQLRAKMTDDEVKAAEREREQEEMALELETLRREKTLSTYKAQYLAQGFDEQLATETAEALVEGDMDGVFDNMRKHHVNLEKALRAKILKETPVPPGGSDPTPPEPKNAHESVALKTSQLLKN